MLEPRPGRSQLALTSHPSPHTQLIDDTIISSVGQTWDDINRRVNSRRLPPIHGLYSGRVDAVTPPYLQTGFNPVALEGTDDDGNGVVDEPWAAQFRADNNAMFVWATYVEDTAAYIIGTRAHAINPFSASYSTRVYARNGVESGVYVSGVTRASGMYGMSRDNSADFDMYVNGANVGTVAQASGVMYSESIQILKRAVNSETCNGNIIRCAGFRAALSDAEYGDLVSHYCQLHESD